MTWLHTSTNSILGGLGSLVLVFLTPGQDIRWRPRGWLIVQFRVHYDRWIKKSEDAFFTGLASIWSNMKKREKDLFITLSIVSIQISNTYLPEFLNILLYVEANPV